MSATFSSNVYKGFFLFPPRFFTFVTFFLNFYLTVDYIYALNIARSLDHLHVGALYKLVDYARERVGARGHVKGHKVPKVSPVALPMQYVVALQLLTMQA